MKKGDFVEKTLPREVHIEINKPLKTINNIIIVALMITLAYLIDGTQYKLIMILMEIPIIIYYLLKRHNYSAEINSLNLDKLYENTILNFLSVPIFLYLITLNNHTNYNINVIISFLTYVFLFTTCIFTELKRRTLSSKTKKTILLLVDLLSLLVFILPGYFIFEKITKSYVLCMILTYSLCKITSKFIYDKKYLINEK